MVFSSLTFLLIFLPILIPVYFVIPAQYRAARNYDLLFFSLVFYSWGEPLYVFLILVTILLTYVLSGKVAQRRKWALIIAIAANLLPLAVFKYTDFILTNINLIPGVHIPLPKITLPIGISFYTFHVFTYIIALYRSKVNIQKNPLFLALYIFFFPQLVAGPIVRYETVEHQITNRKENWVDFQAGLGRFVMGLAKKVLIANQVGFIVKTIMEQEPSQVGSGLLWLAAFSYTIQIYFDFSGYSDMAIGLGRMFGFHFLENFNYPYISRSVTEFWRRWHISLSSFFRDYIYIPMGGNKVSTSRWVFNMLFVWFLTGLWHGPYWSYIIWGLYYCVLLTIEKYLLKGLLERIPAVLSWAYTFLFTMFGWVIFMVETNNPGKLLEFFGRMLSFRNPEQSLTIRTL